MSYQDVNAIVALGVGLAALCWLVQQLFINRKVTSNQTKVIKQVEESIALNRELLETTRELTAAIHELTAVTSQIPGSPLGRSAASN